MFVKVENSGYDKHGEQFCRGLFLILMSDGEQRLGPNNVRAIVRRVAMHQLGHFMMGICRISGKSITLSGTYGADGLICDVDAATFARGIPLPPDLYQAWCVGGGWNDGGTEIPMMHAWANAHLDALRA